MIKKKFGRGITSGLERNFMIRVLADDTNITLATYETFFKEDHGCYVSMCTGREIHDHAATVLSKLPVFDHEASPFPVHFQTSEMIPGKLFGKPPSLFFRLRSKVTLNKSFNKHGLNSESLWAIYSDITILMEADGALVTPHNKFSRTRTSKQDGQNYAFQKGLNGIAQIYLADSNGPFSGDGLRITVNESLGYYGNIEFDEIVPATQAGFHEFGQMFYPVLESPPAMECGPGGVIEISLSLFTADKSPYTDPEKIYVKTDAGYLPRTQVATVGGKAVVKFMALGLDSGEKATLKFGYKWYQNATSTEITVA